MERNSDVSLLRAGHGRQYYGQEMEIGREGGRDTGMNTRRKQETSAGKEKEEGGGRGRKNNKWFGAEGDGRTLGRRTTNRMKKMGRNDCQADE